MKAIIFDLDGTLIHSAPDIHAAANRMLADLDRAELSLEKVTSFIGNGVPKLVERCLKETGLDAGLQDEAVTKFRAYYDKDSATLTTTYDGVDEVLAFYGALNMPMAVCTNKPEGPARDILRALGILDHFAVVGGGDSFAKTKPSPEPLWRVAETMGLWPADTVMVGDSEVDMKTALSARVPFVLFTGGYRKKTVQQMQFDWVFSDWRYLPDVLKGPKVQREDPRF